MEKTSPNIRNLESACQDLEAQTAKDLRQACSELAGGIRQASNPNHADFKKACDLLEKAFEEDKEAMGLCGDARAYLETDQRNKIEPGYKTTISWARALKKRIDASAAAAVAAAACKDLNADKSPDPDLPG